MITDAENINTRIISCIDDIFIFNLYLLFINRITCSIQFIY